MSLRNKGLSRNRLRFGFNLAAYSLSIPKHFRPPFRKVMLASFESDMEQHIISMLSTIYRLKDNIVENNVKWNYNTHERQLRIY